MPLTPRCTRAAPDRALSLAGTQSRRVPFEAAAQYDAIDTYAGDVGPLDHGTFDVGAGTACGGARSSRRALASWNLSRLM